MKKKLSVALLLHALLFGFGIQAQNLYLVIELTNTTTETFAVSGIRSVKFGNTSMVLYQLNGTVTTWEIGDIDHYEFKTDAEIADLHTPDRDALTLFPNPASGNVQILYHAMDPGVISIDILDGAGRQVATVYQGVHTPERTYQWNPDVPAGVYYCRIVTETKKITKPVIIL
jgi:hypothetical protein